MLRVVAGIALMAAVGCSGHGYEPPERTAQVLAEETRVAALIERHEAPAFENRSGRCDVRILGMEGDSTFAWAECTYPAGRGEAPAAGVSTAYRIEGQSVRGPQDGSGYSESIKQLFPVSVAQAILDDQEQVRPHPREPEQRTPPATPRS